VRVKVSARISEKEFQAQVLGLARLSGLLCYHTHDSRRSKPGVPDLVLARPPVDRFVELKTDTRDSGSSNAPGYAL
jgi:hypothetical protein